MSHKHTYINVLIMQDNVQHRIQVNSMRVFIMSWLLMISHGMFGVQNHCILSTCGACSKTVFELLLAHLDMQTIIWPSLTWNKILFVQTFIISPIMNPKLTTHRRRFMQNNQRLMKLLIGFKDNPNTCSNPYIW